MRRELAINMLRQLKQRALSAWARGDEDELRAVRCCVAQLKQMWELEPELVIARVGMVLLPNEEETLCLEQISSP